VSIHEVADFLSQHPPFAGLEEATLREIEAQAAIECFPGGADILVQSGTPSAWLYVLRTGCVRLLDDGETVAVLEPGESFGHPSLLSGLPPAFSVRADEETLCYLLPAELGLRVLSHQSGLSFVGRTLSHRLAAATAVRPAGRDAVRTGRVASLVRRAPVELAPTATLREAAQTLDRDRRTSVLVPLEPGYGIVTDADIRRAVARRLDAEAPIEQIMSAPARTVDGRRLAFEALLEMLDSGVDHLAVLDDDGRATGVVVLADLIGLDGRSPVALKRAIDRAGSTDELVATARRLPEAAVALLDSSVDAVDVCRVIAAHTDALVRRLIALAMADIGAAPAPWAWMAFGSDARREQTLATDQDNGIAHQGEGPEADEYFRRLAERVNDGLAACGIRACTHGVVARNRDWRRTLEGWKARFGEAIESPSLKDTMFASVAFDLRHVTGGLDVEPPLRHLMLGARRRVDFMRMITRGALGPKPPIGFLRDFVVEAGGEHKGRLDLKHEGVVPLVNLARVYALTAGVTGNRTRERLWGAADAGRLDRDAAEGLVEAFDVLTSVRLQHQAAQVEQGRPPDNFVDPHQLPPAARSQLRQAFRTVGRAQKTLAVEKWYGVG
jgi:CBS domain-containing protein